MFERPRQLLALAAIVALAVFAVDTVVEVGVDAAIPYVAVVWLAYAARSRRGVWITAAVCSVLTMVGVVVSPPGGPLWSALITRGLTLIVIWLTAGLCIRVLRLLAESATRTTAAERLAEELSRQRIGDRRNTRAMASVMDDLKVERERLQVSEQRIRLTLESALDAVATFDEQGVIIGWNPQAERTFGWPQAQAVGRSFVDVVVPPSQRDAHWRELERYRTTGRGLSQRLERTALRRSGEEFPIELTISPLQLPDTLHFSAFMRDLTEHKQAEEARARLEQRFRATVESAPTAMVMLNAEGRIVLVNNQTEKLFGYFRDELVGQSVEALVPERFRAQHPSHRAAFIAEPAARAMGEGRELFAQRKNGSEFPVEIGLNPVETDEGVFVLSAIADITERKRLEEAQRTLYQELERRVEERTAALAASNEALEQSNVELQQFAYVASHDLQTPLRTVAGFSQLLRRDCEGKLDPKAEDWLAWIVDGCKRMQTMINDLLTYSRVESRSRPFVPTGLNGVFDETLELMRAEIADVGGEVTRGELPEVIGDRSQLLQLFQNLIGNGLKYHGDHPPRVHVSADRHNDGSTITVRDNGIGIAPEYHEQIFEIFRRLHTQERYPGTGIGLAVCRRIVQRHGGEISLESKEGEGSAFRFTLAAAN